MAIPNIDLEQYLSFVNLIELKKGIKTDSTVSLDFALQYYKNQVEDADIIVNAGVNDPKQTFDVRAEMVDRRTTQEAKDLREGHGNAYQIFSDNYVAKYGMSSWWTLKLDMFSILDLLSKDFSSSTGEPNTQEITLPDNLLSGHVGSVEINSPDGTVEVSFENDKNRQYEVFMMLDETLSIEDRVTQIDSTKFEISLYSFLSFEKKPLDCSVVPARVAYVVVFK